jgi:endonuclease/exonuclease/phosphatase family metal-dependent hydrolase
VSTKSNSAPAIVRVGTLNLRNTSDRWTERYRLLVEQLADLGPDIIGLQELRRPSLQRELLLRGANHTRSADAQPYRLYPAWKTGLRRFWEGIAVLTELPVERHDSLPLGQERIAQRVRVRLADGSPLDFFNTHLHHSADSDLLRAIQMERILTWMNRDSDIAQVLVGDFNARPESAAIELARRHLRSAYAERHGSEPASTVPAPVHHRFGEADEESVIDFIFVNEHVEIHDAWLTFDRVHPEDDRLSASDHFGLAATISVRTRIAP